jgi:retron-type reverse transcriptase
VGLKRKKVNWILDLDVRAFFDTVSHEWLVKFVEHRIADRRILRLIQKWLKAGVSEQGEWTETKVGTPQGAVVSPLLANIYLHYVFDLWVSQWRRKVAQGDMIVVRYADDGAPRAQRAEEGPMCATAGLMRAGPSEPACRSRFQTTFGGCGQKPWS